MLKLITLREANQGFARHVRATEAGDEFTITRNGVPVARLLSAGTAPGAAALTPAQTAALARTFARSDQGWPIGAGTLDRAALHER